MIIREMKVVIIVILSSLIGLVFPLSSSSIIKFSRLQSQHDLQQINLFSEQFTNAIKECHSLDGFSTVPLPQEFSVIQGMLAKKHILSVIPRIE